MKKNITIKDNTKADGDCSPSNCSPHPLLDVRRDSCAWREDADGITHTECGEAYVFEEDWRLFVRYCQGCGGVVWIPKENIEVNGSSV